MFTEITKIIWVKERDYNSKNFHMVVNERGNKMFIKSLENKEGDTSNNMERTLKETEIF